MFSRPFFAILFLILIPIGACSSAIDGNGTVKFNHQLYEVEQISMDSGIDGGAELPALHATFAAGEGQLFLPWSDNKHSGGVILFWGGELFTGEQIAVEKFEQGEVISLSAKLVSGEQQMPLKADLNLAKAVDSAP